MRKKWHNQTVVVEIVGINTEQQVALTVIDELGRDARLLVSPARAHELARALVWNADRCRTREKTRRAKERAP